MCSLSLQPFSLVSSVFLDVYSEGIIPFKTGLEFFFSKALKFDNVVCLPRSTFKCDQLVVTIIVFPYTWVSIQISSPLVYLAINSE